MDPRGVLVVDDSGFRPDGSLPATPPGLEHVANRPIVHHVLDVLASAGVEEVFVASSSERGAEVRDCLAGRWSRDRVRLRYVEKEGPLDLPGAMSLAARLVGEAPCVLHVAGGLLGEPLTPFVKHLYSESPDAVMIVHQGPAPYGHLGPATREMLRLAELDPKRAALGIAGVSLFARGALEHAAACDWWTDRDVDLSVIADRIAAVGGSLHVRLVDVWHAYSGKALDLLELNRIVLDRMESDHRRQDGNGNRIEGRVQIDAGASVQTSVIVGPAIIGAGARIADAYIGPYTAIGAGARVEGAEIERSIISSGASIWHIGCRIAGSVIGQDARVFRDFSLPRAMRLRVGQGTEVALS